jgi:hypothetical protein
MNSLDDAWTWYEDSRFVTELMHRLADKHWESLPWDSALGRDDQFREAEKDQVRTAARAALRQLDDLAVVVLFSVFESVVRRTIIEEARPEAEGIRHRSLRLAAGKAIQQMEDGPFFQVLEPFKDTHADLVEEVNQVRRYRNWVSHGKRGLSPESVSPKAAMNRLRRFLSVAGIEPKRPIEQ